MPQAGTLDVASAPFETLPFHSEHRSSRAGAVFLLLLLLPALGMVVVPAGMVLVFAGYELSDAALHHPLAAAVIGTGLMAWMTLLFVPAKRIIQHFGYRRRVTIARERVTVADVGMFGSSHWSAPLVEFRGVAHHVRATLSGVRHELVLVHPTRKRSLVLHSADAITQSTIDQAAQLLRLQQVPARELYRVSQRKAGPASGTDLLLARAA